ncbi:tyrosine-type recombinase/integrase [Miltoncostaea oceani]|uniref:tyrosine-type recombinase/integrase n=1 Tax=Miltoncostaea oceani TaxID=2843216 RepID=UPI001C3CD75C|nr:site-specific integrase [Miltoncostaea oceani]
MRAPSATTVREAGEAWVAGAREGTVRNRSGDRYKPSVIRGYEASLRRRILPDFGARRLSDVRRSDVQDLADRLLAEGLDPSSVRNALMPLRVLFRRAVSRGEVAVNPCERLQLPAVRGRRERIASPAEAARLIAAVPARDRAIWAAALYGGLRRGELMALRWDDVDLEASVIRVERSWDPKERSDVGTKSRGGRRRVPMAASLRRHLLEHRLLAGSAEGFVFGRTPSLPFDYSSTRARAIRSWRLAGLEPIGLHECRHTYASLMIAAGVNAKALSTYMGHASIAITLDRYGHLMPGNESEAAKLLDAFLARSEDAAPIEHATT